MANSDDRPDAGPDEGRRSEEDTALEIDFDLEPVSHAGGRPAGTTETEGPEEVDEGAAERIRDVFRSGTGVRGGPPRLVVIALVVAVIALGALVDLLRPDSDDSAEGAGSGEPIQRVFHCPDTPTGENADTEISIASNESSVLEASVDIVSDNAEQPLVSVPVEVPSHGTAIVKLSEHSETAGAVSATVPGGEVAVAAKVIRPSGEGSINGVATYRCPDEGAQTWRFATGSTAKGVLMFAYVYNPSDEQVVFDVDFKTRNADEPASRDEPQIGGLTLEPHRRAKIAVHEQVIRRDEVAVTVHAQRGNIVVSNALFPNGGSGGFASTLGVPSTGTKAFFTGGRSAQGQSERVTVLNDTNEIGLVTVLSYPESGSEPVPPKDLEYPAASASTLDLSGVADAGPPLALELDGDVEYTVDQLRTAGNDQALISPLTSTARVWLLPASPADPADGFLEFGNPGDRDIEATIYLLTPAGADSVEPVTEPMTVPAGTRVGLDAENIGVTERGAILVTMDGGGLAGGGFFEQGDWAIMAGIPLR